MTDHIDPENKRCSFCDRGMEHVRRMIQGPNLEICNLCVADATVLLNDGTDDVAILCSFCKLSATRYHAARGSRICHPCIALCVEIIAEADLQVQLPVARVVKDRRPS